MRFKILILFLLISCLLKAQIKIEGKVQNEEGLPIPYINIGLPNQNIGTSSFEDGSFQLTIPAQYQQDSLLFSAIGYEIFKIPLSQTNIDTFSSVILKEKEWLLEEITIQPEKLKKERLGLANRNMRGHISISRQGEGLEVCSLIKPKHTPFRIESVTVNLGSTNLDTFQVRCRFYSVGNDSLPDEILFSEDAIQATSLVKGELTYHFESQDWWLEEPFFVAFEWILNKNQAMTLEKFHEEMPLDFLEKYKEKYPEGKTQIFNKKLLIIKDIEENTLDTKVLTEDIRNYLKLRNEIKPKVYFQTRLTKKSKTYYRTVSQGTRIPFSAVVVASVEVSYEK